MKDISKKRVTRILEASGESNLEKFEDLCKKLELEDQFDAKLHVTERGFDYEDQGGYLGVSLDKDGYWEWNSGDYSENPDESEIQHEEGDGGWNKLMKSLFSSDLSIFVATPYISSDFLDSEDLKENKMNIRNRMKEAKKHKYSFLISNGKGAASRGGDVDGYFEKNVEASSLKNALTEIWKYLNFIGESFEEFCEDYKEEEGESPMAWNEDDLLDYLEEQDISGGEPWLEAYKIDGKMIQEPNYDCMYEYGGHLINVNASDWGIDASKLQGSDEYDDFDDEDEDFEESKKSLRDRLKESSEKTFEELYNDKSSPYYQMSDEVVDILDSIERATSLGPDHIMEILIGLVEGKYNGENYSRNMSSHNDGNDDVDFESWSGVETAYSLFTINAITKDQFIEVLNYYKE